MTWEQLIGKIREGLTESGARIQVLGGLLGDVNKVAGTLNGERTVVALTILTLAVSDLHSVVEHLGIGLDAVVETLRETDKSQEVKGE